MKLRTRWLALLLLVAVPARAQNPPLHAPSAPPAQPAPKSSAAAPASAPPPARVAAAPTTELALAATFGSGATIRSGLNWRVFQERAEADGTHLLVAQSSEATPILPLPEGDYIVHVAYGLAGVARRTTVKGEGAVAERIPLNAGVLRVTGVLGDSKIPPDRLSVDIYVPQPGNFEAKLVVKDARSGDAIGLPEGAYHVVSTYLDTVGVGSLNQPNGVLRTNAVVSADLRVTTGKLTDATLRHHAAVLTLKLVHKVGGEALTNTSFTVLTPGGDVIRELIGAFPSLVLAEGDYVVIARRDGKTYQSNFAVHSGADRDIEVLAQ